VHKSWIVIGRHSIPKTTQKICLKTHLPRKS